MSVHTRILEKYQLSRVPWADPDFPATNNSISTNQLRDVVYEWKRPSELYTHPILIDMKNNSLKLEPGTLGAEWLPSTIGVLFHKKDMLQRVVSAEQEENANATAVYRFKIWWCEQWTEVAVDDRLPTAQGLPCFLRSTNTHELWVSLLEKALAKLHGSYDALRYANSMDGLAELTGGIPETLPLGQVAGVAEFLHISRYNTLVTLVRSRRQAVTGYCGRIEPFMNYLVLDVQEVTCRGKSEYFVLFGHLATDSMRFNHLIVDEKKWWSLRTLKRLLPTHLNGFWMLFSDVVDVFTHMEMVHLTESSPKHIPWKVCTYNGRWTKGVNAGGWATKASSTDGEFFHINPQIQFELKEELASEEVVISLRQHHPTWPKVIGFTLYHLPEKLNAPAKNSELRKLSIVFESNYTNVRHITARMSLCSGAYLLVPTTDRARVEANFALSVLAAEPAEMVALDYVVSVQTSLIWQYPSSEMTSFPQYKSYFLNFADEHKTVGLFELQEILWNCLPNDYVKGCASMSTCREIMLTMERDHRGRLEISDFLSLLCTLRLWLYVFRELTPGTPGVLRVERLRAALMRLGVTLHERALATLVLRYMRPNGTLRFGDFVSALMLLHRTRAFQENDDLWL
ncbi:calpain-C-like [Battus philenor]|uniref:calpain-C-like n=1 Tax=Battus philenor TaxID=42288 RepID=UPI0035D08254